MQNQILNSSNQNQQNQKFQSFSQQNIKEVNSQKIPELPSINPVLKEVNQILDDCTTAYLSKNYEKAKELYNKAKEIYERNNLKDTKTRNRFLSLFDGLRRV